MRKWKFEFPAEVQEKRQAVLNAIDRAMEEATPESVRAAGELARAWTRSIATIVLSGMPANPWPCWPIQ